MANEVLGASFGIDITDLKAGINQANRLIRESESEFKAAAAGMDKWSDSQEGLEARIKHLNTATDLQRKKVDALQEEYDRLIADGLDPASREAVELRTKINNETAALNKNEAELKRQKKALEEVGDASDEAGDAAKEASEGFTVMKGAAANLVAEGITRLVDGCKTAISSLLALGEETREYRTELAKLSTAATTAGTSTDFIKKKWLDLSAVLGDEGAVTEGLNNLMTAGFTTEEALDEITSHLEGAAIKWKDTLKFEGLSDGLQETLATKKAVGPFSELLERAGVNLEKFDAGLAKCKTSADEQNYVLNQLSKLGLAEVSTSYREQNKALIDANKANSAYTDQMAELGEVMEPVNADIMEFKTDLAKELVPVVKNQVAPAIKEFIKKLKESGAVEKIGKAIGWLAENFETLAKVTLTAVTVYKTFSAVMKVAGAITAAKTAIAALSATVGTATKMQTAWNAAMAANPIGAVITAVGLLTAGIVLLCGETDDATKKTKALSKSQQEAVEAAEEAAEAYLETKKAADELASAQIANVDYVTNNLLPSLQKLVDENGKVKEGEEARAQFILGELNNALGTEYDKLSDIYDANGKIKESIYDVIEAKKAQIFLEAYEDTYAEAIKKVAAEEKNRAIQSQAYADQLAVTQKAEEDYLKAAEEYEQSKYGTLDQQISATNKWREAKEEYEEQKAALDEIGGKLKASSDLVKGYYDVIDSYETASEYVLAGESEKAIDIMNKYADGFKTAASVAGKTKDEQLAILREQVAETEIQLKILEADYAQNQQHMTDEQKEQMERRIEAARKQAKDAKDEYYKVGGDSIDGMVKGVEDGEWKLTGALKETVDKAVEAAKSELGIKSPSRVFRREVGRQIPAGAALGVEDGTPSVVKAIKKQVSAIRNAYDLSGVAGTVGVNVNRINPTAQKQDSGNVTVYQTNNYKQAYTSPIEKYKAKQELFAAARLIKAGAI